MFPSYNIAKRRLRIHAYSNSIEYIQNVATHQLPQRPQEFYADKWESWDAYLGNQRRKEPPVSSLEQYKNMWLSKSWKPSVDK